jgi:hypothetical protein
VIKYSVTVGKFAGFAVDEDMTFTWEMLIFDGFVSIVGCSSLVRQMAKSNQIRASNVH